MTKKFIQQQKLVLLAALDRVSGVMPKSAMRSTGEQTGGDLGDVSAAITAAESAIALMSNAANLRWEIERALVKISKGTYGMCEYYNKPIGEERLEAIPWARFSIEAQREIEKGAPQGQRSYQPQSLFDDAAKSPEDEDTAVEATAEEDNSR